MSQSVRVLVAIATYNEIENLPSLVDEIRRYAPDVELLVVDDNSPDGTGKWCDEMAEKDRWFHVMHRPGKLGLGSATVEAMRFAIDGHYDLLLTMDADFSHHPRYIPDLLAPLVEGSSIDVVIGSRYVPGGGVEGWPIRRRWMSRLVNWYARWLLGLSTRDCSGAFRCFRVETLEQLDFNRIQSQGYSFFEELLYRLKQVGARFAEVPIVFVDREKGASKINLKEAFTALWIILRLGLTRWAHRGQNDDGAK